METFILAEAPVAISRVMLADPEGGIFSLLICLCLQAQPSQSGERLDARTGKSISETVDCDLQCESVKEYALMEILAARRIPGLSFPLAEEKFRAIEKSCCSLFEIARGAIHRLLWLSLMSAQPTMKRAALDGSGVVVSNSTG